VSSLLVTGIGELVTNDPAVGAGALGVRHDVALAIDDGLVAWIGAPDEAPAADSRLDVAGRAVIPGFIDSHDHLVFAGDRAEEFAARMAGSPYAAGGITKTVEATRAASDDSLRETLTSLTTEARRQGTTTIECKSGYGLTVEDEARSLRIAGEATTETTFLGAHVVPPEYQKDPDAYVALVCGPMLDACAPYARWIDVFCEQGAFDADATRTVLDAGVARGLTPRLHVNQLHPGPGVQIAVEYDAASADHCSHLTDADVGLLADSNTVATLLPSAEFCTRATSPDARRLLDVGAQVAIATDCNPGSSFTTSMPFCIALAVREMGMTPAEALYAATAGGAQALRRNDIGRLAIGLRADLAVLDAPTYVHLAYRPGVPLVSTVVQGGAVVKESR
jgi:imidazolonepropionase